MRKTTKIATKIYARERAWQLIKLAVGDETLGNRLGHAAPAAGANTAALGAAPSHGPTGSGISPQSFGAAPAHGPAPQLTVSGGQPLLPVNAWAGGTSQAPPATAAQPAQPAQPARPQQYRGQGGFGDQKTTPARAPYMKTWEQLNQEQNVDPNNITVRKGLGTSIADGMTGGLWAGTMAAGNLAGTVIGRPATYAYDKATGSNTNEQLNDVLTHMQDVRDRGMHQMLYNRTSTALNDREAADTAMINQYGTLQQKNTNNLRGVASSVMPYAAPAGLGTLVGRVAGLGARAGGAAGTAAFFGPMMTDAAGLTESTPADLQHSKLTPTGSGGATATIPTRFGNQTTDFSQLSPEQAGAFAADPKNEQTIAGIWNAPGQLPNNMLTPAERVNNGQFDPTTGQRVDLSSSRTRAPSADQVAQAQPQEQDESVNYNDVEAEINKNDQAGLYKFLPEGATPEVQQQTTQAADTVKETAAAAPPGAVNAALQDPAGKDAQQFASQRKPAFDQQAQEEYAAAVPQPTNGNPQDYGKWMADMGTHIEKSWGDMGPMGQLAFGLGVPMALIGMMSGNIGGFLMSALGLGAAGMAGAAGGMFGQGGQDAMGNMIDFGAQALGMNVPKGPQDMSRLVGDDAVGNIQKDVAAESKTAPGESFRIATNPKARAAKQESVRAHLSQVDSVKSLAGMSEPTAVAVIMAKHRDPQTGKPPTREVAQQIYQNAIATAGHLNNPDSEMAKQVATGRQFDANPEQYIAQQAGPYIAPAMKYVTPALNFLYGGGQK